MPKTKRLQKLTGNLIDEKPHRFGAMQWRAGNLLLYICRHTWRLVLNFLAHHSLASILINLERHADSHSFVPVYGLQRLPLHDVPGDRKRDGGRVFARHDTFPSNAGYVPLNKTNKTWQRPRPVLRPQHVAAVACFKPARYQSALFRRVVQDSFIHGALFSRIYCAIDKRC